MKHTAKSIIARSAEYAYEEFLQSRKGIHSPNFKGIEEFHNDTERDFRIAYTTILRAHLQDVINEINEYLP
tara:strand:+ start:262 stop:474 length:213 start_codon:yes stop_codon:yes gene_type:complete